MILETFKLNGSNALVTGARAGIGAGIAVALAEAGANVALHGREAPPEKTAAAVRAMGQRVVTLAGDLTDPSACEALVNAVSRELGSIDILVNNAAIIRRAPAADTSVEDWNIVIQTNLTSVFCLCKLAADHMLKQGRGKIINIASLLSFQGGILVPAYAAAKGGVAQLTKALANEWASKGINVNAIAPGYIATENTAPLREDPVRNRQILERIPAGRWGTPQDVSGAAVFLASAASDYLNGHVLVVDGGWLAR
jgi:2-deoxy-D-gluconate 3-dehydrogenase